MNVDEEPEENENEGPFDLVSTDDVFNELANRLRDVRNVGRYSWATACNSRLKSINAADLNSDHCHSSTVSACAASMLKSGPNTSR